MTPTLEEIYCYGSKRFSITFDGSTLNVTRERDKALLASVPIPRGNQDLLDDTFRTLKNKYILDYDNVL